MHLPHNLISRDLSERLLVPQGNGQSYLTYKCDCPEVGPKPTTNKKSGEGSEVGLEGDDQQPRWVEVNSTAAPHGSQCFGCRNQANNPVPCACDRPPAQNSDSCRGMVGTHAFSVHHNINLIPKARMSLIGWYVVRLATVVSHGALKATGTSNLQSP